MPTQIDPVAALSQLAHEQATAALAEQRHVLEGLRTRASTQAASAAVATSFLGSEALRDGSPRAFTWIAIGCFVGVVALTLAVHWPRLGAELAIRPLLLVRDTLVVDHAHDPSLVLRGLATRLGSAYALNERLLARLASCVRVSSILGGFAVLSWVADLATRS
jgi:hypothetical protein